MLATALMLGSPVHDVADATLLEYWLDGYAGSLDEYHIVPERSYRTEPPPRVSPPPTVEYVGDVEDWRPLIQSWFLPADVPWAMRVMDCESEGNPNAKNPGSTASGLFQHLATYWDDRSGRAGWGGADIFDPVANVAVAAWLYYLPEEGGPGHWVCK